MFHRDLVDEIKQYMNHRQALFILGTRQSGKTTIMKILMKTLPAKRSLLLDMEKMNDRKLIENGAEEFIRYLKSQGMNLSEKNYVFIDEIQHYPEFSSFIKLMVDYHSESVKLILSGSSAVQILMQFKDSLAGRKFVFHLHPLTFREYLIFKGKKSYAEKLKGSFYSYTKDDLKYFRYELLPLLEEFIIYGGYPEIVKTDSHDDKKRLLTELIDAYVIKDIRWLFNIRDINLFNHLIKYLAVTNGNLLSVQNVANEIGISRQTVNSYVKILEDTFICRKLPPYSSNKVKEFRKMPKLFFLDTGLRNTLVESFVPLSSRQDAGLLFENYIFTQLLKKKGLPESIYFWRTQQKQEVDFVIKKENNLFTLEAKIRAGKLGHLKKFSQQYNCNGEFLVSYKNEFEMEGNITALPGYLV